MEKDFEKHTTIELRKLYIKEAREFISRLENNSTEELTEFKIYLKYIYDLLVERERKEQTVLLWGKGSTKSKDGKSKTSSGSDSKKK